MAKSYGSAAAVVPAPAVYPRQRVVSIRAIRGWGVRWHWIVLAGMAAPLLTVLLATLAKEICSFAGLDLGKQGGYLSSASGSPALQWGVPLLNLLLTLGLAVWVARRAGRRVVLHGVSIGLCSALFGLALGFAFRGSFEATLGFYYPNLISLFSRLPFRLASSLLFRLRGATVDVCRIGLLFLTIGAGWWGGRRGRSAQAGREALYEAIWAISTATTPQEIVAAIGEHLAGKEVSHVILWRVTAGESWPPREIVPLAAWTPWGVRNRLPGLRLDRALVRSLSDLRGNLPLRLQVDEPPFSSHAVWEKLGARSAFFLPLMGAGGALKGVLMAASPQVDGLKRCHWGTHPIGAQVALALENLHLVEQARQAAVLEERQRLAREIHDTLAQGFTSIVMHLEAAEQSLPDELAKVHRHLDQARRAARVSLAQARQVVWALRPDILENDSLPAALERVTTRWAEGGGVKAHVATTGTAMPLPPDVEVTLLRATQEALANVRRHSCASQVAVTVSYMGDLVVLDVQDDGVGFDPAPADEPPTRQAAGGFGLTAMRERVEQLGGTLIVESSPGEGTTLVVEIPFLGSARMESGSAVASRRERWMTVSA
jgi:signal transduction histidine kinase